MWNLAVPWWELIVRSAVIYFALIVALRLFGKRQIGQFTIFDLVLILLVANAVQPAMTGPDNSLHMQPANAIKAALAKTDIKESDLDVVEINEAFACVGIVSGRNLNVAQESINPNGGAIALGHPIGMSGARLVITLANELKRRGGGVGAAALCGGGGQGDALILRV